MEGSTSNLAAAGFIGIDVSKSTFDVHLRPTGRQFSVAANDEGLAELRKELGALGPCLVVVEATGGLERRLVAELIDAGLMVSRVNPRQVRDFARALGRLAKTDRIDAEVLSLYGEKVQPRPMQKQPEKQAELDALVTRRRQLVGLRSVERVRQHQAPTKSVGCISHPFEAAKSSASWLPRIPSLAHM